MHRNAEIRFDRALAQLRRRLLREATFAIEMLEGAIEALHGRDFEAARRIRRADDRVDIEEVEIEQEVYRLMITESPYASDFRLLAFILRANAAVERVADHACSIAKVTRRLEGLAVPALPAPLVDLCERIPIMCHQVMRAVLDEDADSAREIGKSDEVMDDLDRQVFRVLVEQIHADVETAEAAMLLYRISRELERVGDLMVNIAEDVVYLVEGEIVRHEKRRKNAG